MVRKKIAAVLFVSLSGATSAAAAQALREDVLIIVNDNSID